MTQVGASLQPSPVSRQSRIYAAIASVLSSVIAIFRTATWRDILSHIAELTEPPVVIVTSRAADADLRAEVHALGGYGVLAKPFQEEEVIRVAIAAWREQGRNAPEPAPA